MIVRPSIVYGVAMPLFRILCSSEGEFPMRLSNATPPCPIVVYNVYLLPFYLVNTLELWETESEACHTALVLVNCRGAILLGLFGVAEE